MDMSSVFQKPSGTVLIVDDDEAMRELLRFELELAGFTVLTAENGATGLEKAKKVKPDIILMDVVMPVMNGIEATRQLKENESTCQIPVLIITAVERKADLIKGLEAGAIDYVNKPFFAPEIRARVKAILRFKKMFDEIVKVKEEFIRESMIRTIYDSVSIVQETIDDNTESILGCVHKKTLSDNEISIVKGAVQNIRNTVANLNYIDKFAFKLYEKLADIVATLD